MRKVVLTLLILAVISPCFAKYSGGTGEPNTPYQIATAEDLNDIGNHKEDFNKCFIITEDINMAGISGSEYRVIGSQFYNFKGVFDGNNHSISNFTGDVGLFGYVYGSGAAIRNLGLIDVNVKGSSAGSLVSRISSAEINNCYVKGGTVAGSGGLVYYGSGNISNCYTTCNISGISSGAYVGGIIGYYEGGKLSHCYSTGNITNKSASGSEHCGGIVGVNGIGGHIYRCYSKGKITNYGDSGGLVGCNSGIVEECWSISDVADNGFGGYIGGLVGINAAGTFTPASIINCYARGLVILNGSGYAGGLSYAGGLIGVNSAYRADATVRNCYSTGEVRGFKGETGGLVGLTEGNRGVYIESFWDVNTSGQTTSAGGTGKTTAEMQTQSTFTGAGWDFDNVWHICETTNYPKLKWQILPGDIVCPDGVDIYDLAALCDQWLVEEIPADLTPTGGDGIVNFADFAVFAGQWGVSKNIYALNDFSEQWLKVGLRRCSADISPLPDGDGRVNFADFALMANNWLQGF